MRSIGVLSALVLSVSLSPCLGQLQPQNKPASADPYRNEAIVFEKTDTIYRMNADGTGERDLHVRVRIQSDGAAQQFGVLSFGYAAASETPKIKYVRVHKADGTTVETPGSEAIDMPATVTREAPLYSDLKEKHLPVRSLAAGDTLEYEVDTSIDKPETPGQFWGATHFTPPGTIVVLSEGLTLEVPANKDVQVWSPNHKPTVAEHDGLRIYTWEVQQLVPAPKRTGDESSKPVPPKDPDEDGEGRKLPSVAWTTFHSWAEVGDWYRKLALSRAEPDAAVRAQADQIAKDAKTPEEQVRALYNFVSSHTRYVGIDFGIGRYQPHTAAEVLANQYGDCKDKDTLLEALLRAKGFSTAPALIGAGIAPVPEVPTPAVFNHVITTVNLPGGRIWLDSTPQAAPYQYLSAVIRDQKALVVPSDSPATLESTPATAPYPFTARFEADATLDADGKLTGKITTTYRDDDEVLVRALARNVAPAEWDKASQFISSNTGFGGTTSETQFTNGDDSSQPIKMTYQYSRHPYGDWENRRIVPLLPAAEFTTVDSDNPPQEDIQLGAPRTLTAISRIHLPEGYHTDLPDAVHVKADFATFDKTYRYENDEVVVERTVVVLKNKVAKSDWKKYESFTKDIGLEGETWIQLIQPQKNLVMKPVELPAAPGGTSKGEKETIVVKAEPPTLKERPKTEAPKAEAPTTAPDETATVAELMTEVQEKLRAGDLEGAKETLDKVKAKNPDEENLWSSYGLVATLQHNFDEAKSDFGKELAVHPDNGFVVGALAEAERQSGDSSAARQTVQKFLARHPDELRLSLYLANLQTQAEDYAGALKTLETAADQHPDDRSVRLMQSEALRRLNRNEEAAAAAKSVLDGTDDPGMLNDAAYTLSETGLDLTVAEDASRRSIAKLEEKSATISTAEANSRTFGDANLLIASWDTLGWILYREGKLDAAQPLLSAAWRASMRAEVADDLGQVYEGMGQKDKAATMYALAGAALTPNEAPDIREHIAQDAARLKAAGAKAGPAGTIALQELRTYKIHRPAEVGGWGTFRLEITTAGVIESQQMSGEKQIAGVKSALDAMKFPELLPPDSKAHLLRSAVVSCSMGTNCEVVLVPDGGLQTERQ
jgi:transglutaminase-like putative cysteine protease/tetratricopeptide (TPR) repeat protein